MKAMNAEFERSETGGDAQSREPGKEKVCGKQTRPKMDDEGCPDNRKQPEPHPDGDEIEVGGLRI
jgi:hypothetical protein